MTPNSPPNSPPECGRFFALFQQHWNAGSGLAEHSQRAKELDGGKWIIRTFCDAMERAANIKIDTATVQSWLAGRRWPQKEKKEAILKVLFRSPRKDGAGNEISQDRCEMQLAWEEGQAARTRSQSASYWEDQHVNVKWVGVSTPVRTAGLASLNLDAPIQGNEHESSWYLQGRLRFDISEYEREDGSPVYIGLREAFLTVTSTGYRMINRSFIGERASHPNFQPKPDGAEVIGPKLAETGLLKGEALEEDHIVLIVPADGDASAEAVTASLSAFRRSFEVSLTPISDKPPEGLSSEKDAVLNALIVKGRKDSQGRVLLAQDTMRRKKVE